MKHKGDILIVDDEDVVLQGARKILMAEGLKVDTVGGADAAIARLRDKGYSLVLTDLMLPGMDGIDLMLALRRRRSQTPVVIVTGFATLDRAIDSFRNGAFDFLPKPFDVEELTGIVRRGLGYACRVPAGRSLDPEWASPPPAEVYRLGHHTEVALKPDGSAGIRLGWTFADLGSDLVSVTLPDSGDEIRQGNECARVTAQGESVHRVWAPLSGHVVPATPAPKFAPRSLNGTRLFDIRPTDLEQELLNLTRRPRSGLGAALLKEATW